VRGKMILPSHGKEFFTSSRGDKKEDEGNYDFVENVVPMEKTVICFAITAGIHS